jgi:hypothetical protein
MMGNVAKEPLNRTLHRLLRQHERERERQCFFGRGNRISREQNPLSHYERRFGKESCSASISMPPEAEVIIPYVAEIFIQVSELTLSASSTGLKVSLVPPQVAPPPEVEGVLPCFGRFSMVLGSETRRRVRKVSCHDSLTTYLIGYRWF